MTEKTETRGRPTESRDGGVRHIRKVRFSDTEWAWCKAQAEAKGLTTSEWLRRRVLWGMR